MASPVRVRFAPSPTGHLHVGVARTAILNWLFARRHQGVFILRIEDTDQARSTKESEQMILDDLHWLGVHWDEGPAIEKSMPEGEYGPYRQMERVHLYRQVAEQLLASGHAYRCFVPQEEIDAKREQEIEAGRTAMFRSPYRQGDEAVWRAKVEAGEPFAIRLRVPDDLDEVVFADHVKGEMRFKAETIPEFVLLRANGIPSYNFAVVVDDALMKISHVIRGDDHLTNTPKQILIYRAMNWPIPEFAHIPMILGPDRSKLSKRHGAVSIGQFMEDGYLPQALINFLSLLSWSSTSEEEILAVERLIAEIDLDRISGSAAVFDRVKLNWMNGHYIRQLSEDAYLSLATPFLQKAGYPIDPPDITKKALNAIKDKIEILSQIKDHAAVFFTEQLIFENDEARAIAAAENSRLIFHAFTTEAAQVDQMTADTFRNVMKAVQTATGIKGKDLWIPIRVGLTGQTHGPDLGIIIEVLGKARCLARIQQATTTIV